MSRASDVLDLYIKYRISDHLAWLTARTRTRAKLTRIRWLAVRLVPASVGIAIILLSIFALSSPTMLFLAILVGGLAVISSIMLFAIRPSPPVEIDPVRDAMSDLLREAEALRSAGSPTDAEVSALIEKSELIHSRGLPPVRIS